jgi:hypothetical protein
MKILTLFVQYGTEKYQGAEDALCQWYASHLPGTEWKRVIIDNALQITPAEGNTALRKVIAGDNSNWEFSGWTHAIKLLRSELCNYDYIHLATSAFNELYTKHLELYSPQILEHLLNRPLAIGHIDCYNESVFLTNYCFQSWIRSCWIFLPAQALLALDSLVSINVNDYQICSNDFTTPFLSDAPLSKNYREYILSWLTGSGTGQGVKWHSANTLTTENFEHFKKKVVAIFNEHLLSVRLQSLGFSLLDITWLSTNLNKCDDLVSWKTQLKERARDAIAIY